jgi:hypothetical protein
MPTKLTHEIIAAAILGFEEQKRKIDSQIGETESDDGSCLNSPAATAETPKRKRRKMSVAARKRIAAAQTQEMGGGEEAVCGGATSRQAEGCQTQAKTQHRW